MAKFLADSAVLFTSLEDQRASQTLDNASNVLLPKNRETMKPMDSQTPK